MQFIAAKNCRRIVGFHAIVTSLNRNHFNVSDDVYGGLLFVRFFKAVQFFDGDLRIDE